MSAVETSPEAPEIVTAGAEPSPDLSDWASPAEAPTVVATPKKKAKTAPGTKAPKKAPKAKPKPAKAQAPAKKQKMSALSAAHMVLAAASEPMRVGDIVDRMAELKLWKSPNGGTPNATLSAAIFREIANKGHESRFAKAGPGLYKAASK